MLKLRVSTTHDVHGAQKNCATFDYATPKLLCVKISKFFSLIHLLTYLFLVSAQNIDVSCGFLRTRVIKHSDVTFWCTLCTY